MPTTIRLSEAERRKPGFITERKSGIPWVLKVKNADGSETTLEGVDWEVLSRFGAIRNVVVCDREGNPLFERPEYRESANVNVVVWAEEGDEIYIAVLHEERPHADNQVDPNTPTTIGQTAMGFLDKIIGKMEAGSVGAAREASEETGSTVTLDVTQPSAPYHYPNPTFVPTVSDLYFVKVDLTSVREPKTNHGELIYRAEYIPLIELLERVSTGEHDGAVYRGCTSNSIWFVFLTNLLLGKIRVSPGTKRKLLATFSERLLG